MSVKAYDWIRHHALRTPDKVASVDLYSERRLTYAEMDQRIGRLAQFLRHTLGVERGDRVAVLSRNSTDIFDIQFACGRLGAIFMPLNWRLALPELEYVLTDSTPRTLIYDGQFADAAEALEGEFVATIVELDCGGGDCAFEYGIAHADGAVEPEDITHDDISTILYTSGTTGLPKGAIISHGMTFWNAVNMGMTSLVTPKTVCLAFLPLFHTGGLNCYCNIAYHVGGTVVIMREFDPGRALDYLIDPALGVTHALGVPANFLFMSQQPKFESIDLSGIQIAGIGGAPCALSILEIWEKKGVALQQLYGMTETSPLVLTLDPDDATRKPGSSGKPALHTEVRLVDEAGDDVIEPDQVGEIWVKGPNVTPGYWNRPEETAEAIVDGWLKTGDAAYRDAEGYYYIVDRWKDMYISGGENVYPAEVENVIYQLPEVAEVAVIGVPDDRWGEVGQAVVALKAGERLGEADILKHCDGKLARFKQPKSVRFIDALPRNATGKVLKRELRAPAT